MDNAGNGSVVETSAVGPCGRKTRHLFFPLRLEEQWEVENCPAYMALPHQEAYLYSLSAELPIPVLVLRLIDVEQESG